MTAPPIRAGLIFVTAFASLALSLTLPARAGAFVYWADPGTDAIGRANLDGTGVDAVFIPGGSDPCGVAVSDTHIWWANRAAGTVGRANLDGTGVAQSFIAGASAPCGVAVSDSHVFWANGGPGATRSIGRANLDGSGVAHGFIALDGVPCGVAVSAVGIYWAERSGELFGIGRANFDGTGVNERFILSGANPCGVALSATHIHWANRFGGAIGRAAIDGSAVQAQLIPAGSVSACGVAVTATHIWWAISSTGAIGRANVDGSAPNPGLISAATAPCGVAVTSEPPPRTPPPPPTTPPPPVGPEPAPVEAPPAFRDGDLDGVADPFDRCPSVFGAGTRDGCRRLGVRPILIHRLQSLLIRQGRLRVVLKGKRQCPLPTRLKIFRVVGAPDVGPGPDPQHRTTAFPDRLIARVSEDIGRYRVAETVRPGTFYAFRRGALDSGIGRCPAIRSRLRAVRAPTFEAETPAPPGPQPTGPHPEQQSSDRR